MLNVLLILIGAALWAAIMADFLMTTISAQGQGTFSKKLGEALWGLARAALDRWDSYALRAAVGPTILTLIGCFWIFGTWLAWMLLFSGTGALQITTTNEPADVLGVFVYTGSSLSTAGSSNIEVSGRLGGALTVLAAVNGMVVLTLTVSFILNLLQTIKSGRTFAIRTASAKKLSDLDRPSAMAGFVDVCTELNMNPLALYFAPPRADLSTADAVTHFTMMTREDGSDCAPFERRLVDKSLSMLPFTSTASDELPDEDELKRWRDRYGTERGREDALGARLGREG